MKTSDFRIGNRVNGGVVTEVHEGFITCAGPYNITGMTSFQFNEIKPELLTEEWLERFGFKWKEEETYPNLKYWTNKKCHVDLINNRFHIPKYKEGDDHVSIRRSLYVHQLQNLFYTLTGEELTLKTTT